MKFPNPLETERLIIRTPTPEDAAALNEAILETWDMLSKWMPWAVTKPLIAESLETCTRMFNNTEEERDYALFCFDRQTGEFIMASGAHPRNPDVPAYEIGYWCRTSKQGQGYVIEAVNAITEACFESMNARRIEIRCDKRNEASSAVALRCGYGLEGTFKNDARDAGGALRTTLIFALTRNDP